MPVLIMPYHHQVLCVNNVFNTNLIIDFSDDHSNHPSVYERPHREDQMFEGNLTPENY